MRTKTTIRIQAAGLALIAGVATVAWAQAMKTVRYNGATVSQSVRIIDGKPWVPLSDAARLVGGSVVPDGSGYEIRGGNSASTAGGANEVTGLNGKIGDVLFDGHWRCQVLSLTPADTYTLTVPSSEQDFARYHDTAEMDNDTHTFTPKAGYTFFAVKCHVKNGQKATEQLDGYLDDPKTALTDGQENSYPPIVYDMVSKGAWMTRPLLPGSGEDLTLLFAVPTGTTPKDLVFTLKNWSEHIGRNVRVSLAPNT
jgi:hypothetical protein